MPDKNENIEQTIPPEWRPALIAIVEDIRSRNLRSKEALGYDISIDLTEIDDIYRSIDHYGGELVSLPEDTWKTSICRWMGSYWHLLIDLFTAEEGLSDLVLFVDAYEQENFTSFRIRSVHVP